MDKRFSLFKWGPFAVDLFFILSGFILNWVYCSKEPKSINWLLYLKARIGRIMPLYYLTTALYLSIPLYGFLKYGMKAVDHDYLIALISNIFMVSGITGGWHITFNTPAWSISVEFFCYLILFPLLVALQRILLTKRYYPLFCLLIVALSIRLLVLSYRVPLITVFYWPWDSQFLGRGIFGFSAGFFLCSIYKKHSCKSPNIALINMITLTSVGVLMLAQLSFIPNHLLIYIWPFLVYFTAYDQGFVANCLKLNPLQWLGERSYSIYLWHMPIMAGFAFLSAQIRTHLFKNPPPMGLLNCILLITLVLVISELSYRYFETPCRDYIRSLGEKRISKAQA